MRLTSIPFVGLGTCDAERDGDFAHKSLFNSGAARVAPAFSPLSGQRPRGVVPSAANEDQPNASDFSLPLVADATARFSPRALASMPGARDAGSAWSPNPPAAKPSSHGLDMGAARMKGEFEGRGTASPRPVTASSLAGCRPVAVGAAAWKADTRTNGSPLSRARLILSGRGVTHQRHLPENDPSRSVARPAPLSSGAVAGSATPRGRRKRLNCSTSRTDRFMRLAPRRGLGPGVSSFGSGRTVCPM